MFHTGYYYFCLLATYYKKPEINVLPLIRYILLLVSFFCNFFFLKTMSSWEGVLFLFLRTWLPQIQVSKNDTIWSSECEERGLLVLFSDCFNGKKQTGLLNFAARWFQPSYLKAKNALFKEDCVRSWITLNITHTSEQNKNFIEAKLITFCNNNSATAMSFLWTKLKKQSVS